MPNDLVPSALAARMTGWRKESKSWTPHDYQGRALQFVLKKPLSGLLLDPGMGKTSITLAMHKIRLKKKLSKRMLVIAPLRACEETWPAEVCDWTDFKDFSIALLHGPNKDKVLRSLGPEHKICIINPEGIQWLATKQNMELLNADTLVVDESSLWKSGTTVRFKALRKHLHKFSYRHILTGSPRPRHYLDLYGQIFLLDLGDSLGTYYTHYRNTFFFPTGFMMREWELLPDSAEKIDKIVAPMVMRLDGEDYLKLPRIMEQTHRIDLPPKARKVYNDIENSLLSTLFSAPMVTSAAARAKCCQIANGSVYLDDDPDEHWGRTRQRPSQVVHTAKVEAVVDLVNELQGEPLLLGIGYHHDVTALRKALGKDVPVINSQTTKAQAAKAFDDWNKGLLPVLMGHPASMGHSLNLQKFNARHVGFFDIPDNYDYYDQFFKRVRRQGNKSAFVMLHNFVVANTVDVVKMRNLRAKAKGQGAFLAAMKKYSEERRRGKDTI